MIFAVIVKPASGGFYPPLLVVAISSELILRGSQRAASLFELSCEVSLIGANFHA
jgi:hypothetical protein